MNDPPPPLPDSLSWTRIATFPSVTDWHAANRILARRNIPAQMWIGPTAQAGVDLLVPATEVAWATALIAGPAAPAELQSTGGFPLDDPSATPIPPQTLRAVPVQQGLSAAQQQNYSHLLLALWILLALTVLLFLAGSLVLF
jgi:hypothetical protein